MANGCRLIDADAILQKIQLECNGYLQTSELTFAGLMIAKKIIEQAPTVDAVEVVRCKDCKHYVAPQGTYVCDCFEGLNFATDNDFCSYGERREGE